MKKTTDIIENVAITNLYKNMHLVSSHLVKPTMSFIMAATPHMSETKSKPQ